MITTDLLLDVKQFSETFSPTEAREVISSVIDKKINSCKVEYLSQWERNHHFESYGSDELINSLKMQKQDLIDLINEANRNGQKVKLNCSIELTHE